MSSRALRRTGWNVLGLLVFGVMVFPVFWMISTAFKPDEQIYKLTPTWIPLHPTIRHFTDAIHRPFFWDAVKNSVIIVTVKPRPVFPLIVYRQFTGRGLWDRPATISPSRPLRFPALQEPCCLFF